MKEYMPLRKTFRKYITGQLNETEANNFLTYIKTGKDDKLLKELVSETLADPIDEALLKESKLVDILDESWDRIQGRIPRRSVVNSNRWKLVAAIAALFLAIVSIGLWRHLTQVSSVTEELTHQGEIIPGTQTATLTLADGKKIKLIDAQSGVLEEETGGLISKNADGTLVYKEIEGHIVSSGYNTLSTARGETYKVQLPDGTQVWLNASSTIRYAASFKGRAQRYIELEGEAYFDVAKDKNHPFVVKTSTQEVEVLGTRFNINSYADEVAVNTTLLEGTVQINYQDKKTLLHPGQQANLSVAGTLQINMVDTDPIISWINNEFMFDGDDIETVMRKISRWYNVDVVYIGARTREKFGGGLSRFEEVGQVLAMLEKTGAVRFKVEGKTIYVRAA